jgi:hypothetical protein
MTTLVVAGVALVGGFVAGVLFGRKNKKTVEAVVSQANKIGK